MSELDKLEQYLKDNGIKYKRTDENSDIWGRHQIIVFGSGSEIAWDAICHQGSYGFAQGLLEIYGTLVDEEKDGDSVVGWLTAEDVIKRIEQNQSQSEIGDKKEQRKENNIDIENLKGLVGMMNLSIIIANGTQSSMVHIPVEDAHEIAELLTTILEVVKENEE